MKRLNKISDERNLIPKAQLGFSKGCSVTHQLVRLTKCISTGFMQKQSTVAVFLDVSKAYDSTWPTGLLYKLSQMQIPSDLIFIIQSYLAQRSFRVKVDGARSSWRPMLAGVPQGSTLSPLLYNLYTADIPQTRTTEIAMYADDVCIYAKTKNLRFAHLAVQRHLSEVEEWAKKWRILINTEKTNCIVFSKKRNSKLPPLEMYWQETGFTKRGPYLGVMLHHRITGNRIAT